MEEKQGWNGSIKRIYIKVKQNIYILQQVFWNTFGSNSIKMECHRTIYIAVILLLFTALFTFLGTFVLLTRYPNNIPGPIGKAVYNQISRIYGVRWRGSN